MTETERCIAAIMASAPSHATIEQIVELTDGNLKVCALLIKLATEMRTEAIGIIANGSERLTVAGQVLTSARAYGAIDARLKLEPGGDYKALRDAVEDLLATARALHDADTATGAV